MNPPVFLGSALVVIAFAILGGGFTAFADKIFPRIQVFVADYFGWFYIFTASLILLAVVALLLSPYGRIRLGKPDAKPEFGYTAWFAMLFSAGMGTGLVFWGVAEPMSHFLEPPTGEPGTAEAATRAMAISFFHWGLHPWAIYTLFALAIGYFHFRIGLPLAPRSMLYPLFGDRIHGWIGHLTDIVCTVGTLFGVATSLGLGAMQIQAGVSTLTPIDAPDLWIRLAIIAGITGLATISVVVGVHKGIQRLAGINMWLALGILLFVFIAGPTVFILEVFTSSIGVYLQELPRISFHVNIDPSDTWQQNWTIYYWSWWISWSPFVGIFVARVSYGRTIREFVLSVLLIPTLVTFLWLSVVGGTGLHMELLEGRNLAEPILAAPETALHRMLGFLPLAGVTMMLATLLIGIFFITSSDSGSLVDDMVTSGGHPNPPRAQRVFWAVSEGTVAGVILYAGGETGLDALRTASLQSGVPVAILLLLTLLGLWMALRRDYQLGGRVPKPAELTYSLMVGIRLALRPPERPATAANDSPVIDAASQAADDATSDPDENGEPDGTTGQG